MDNSPSPTVGLDRTNSPWRTNPSAPFRLLFVISNLSFAGGQRQMLLLAEHMDRNKFTPEICTLSEGGGLESEIAKLKIPLWRITKKFRWDPSIFFRFASLCRQRQTQVVYSFLDFDNLVGRIGGRLANVPLIIASELSADYTLPFLKDRLDRWTANWSDFNLANTFAGERFLIKSRKISKERIKVIHSSLDPKVLEPTMGMGEVRQKYSIPQDTIVVGMAARRRPQKNWELCFKVADVITSNYSKVWFLLLGDTAPTFDDYSKWIDTRQQQLRHRDRVILGGHLADIGAFYREIDIFLITSDHEGLPNVLMGAMAYGVPVVATDVGDNEYLVGSQGGFITPIGNEHPLISGLSKLIEDSELRRLKGEYNRQRASELFSVSRMVSETETIIQELYWRKHSIKNL